ncbi:flagellar basal-body MS-ring/collar protein FliF [uncultured Tateyamaria sp.]|uniref:flagellar basal-body MS-ring/collar protein FliF n=1 Tax=Tateyamaria sp. 1078 TaxID=3417464 RepID=UPI002619C7FC|nr:flagellar basal-body MS-ring/collar protein FliF [uncultured Tateyamaria sp.]
MQQLLNAWMNLDMRRQITVVVATIAMFLAVLTMSRIVAAPSMTLLYAGLENGAAGDVVRSLEQRGVPFEIRGNSIFVESRQRDQLRMTLASEGLPANSSRGYELLDGLSGFGTTSQMFDAAYWRAKEGELARTIAASPHVAMARVHIASTGSNPFQRGVTPTASVSITPNGSGLTAQQGKAVRFLVASAVAGLSADDVAVIDANGTLIGSVDEDAPAAGADDKAQVLRERVERLLEARVGHGNAIVEVSVDTVTETEEIRERRFDPEGRVAISTDTEERTSNSNEEGGGNVTVASNLPDGDAGGNETATSQDSETRERVNYEVSETERAITRAPGAIKRLTVAVLVNDVIETPNADATPRTEEELRSLQELVAAAVGFDESRGDIITIKAMPLQSAEPVGTAAESSLMDLFAFDVMSALQMAVLAIVTLILGLFVVRPILTKAPAPAMLPPAETGQAPAMIGGTSDVASASPQSDFPDIDLNAPLPDLPALPPMGLQDGSISGTVQSADPVERLRNMIGERQEETVEILRSWLEEDEERA